MAEGAPLLREYRVKSLIEGSNPSLSANIIKALDFQGFFCFLRVALGQVGWSNPTCAWHIICCAIRRACGTFA